MAASATAGLPTDVSESGVGRRLSTPDTPDGRPVPFPCRKRASISDAGMYRQAWRWARPTWWSFRSRPDALPPRDDLNALQAVIDRGKTVDAYDTVTAQPDILRSSFTTRCEC